MRTTESAPSKKPFSTLFSFKTHMARPTKNTNGKHFVRLISSPTKKITHE